MALPPFREEGVSGTLLSRPEFDRLLQAARSQEFDVVVVTRLDRLARLHSVYLELADQLERLGIQLLVLDSDYDTHTPQGRAMRTVQVAFAQLDRDTIVQKMAFGARHKALTEQSWPTSRTPFGYQHAQVVTDEQGKRKVLDGRLVHDPNEVKIIRLAYTMLVEEAATTGEVCQHLNALGITAPMGGAWSHGNLRRKMSSQGLLGRFLWGDPTHGGTGKYGDPIPSPRRADPDRRTSTTPPSRARPQVLRHKDHVTHLSPLGPTPLHLWGTVRRHLETRPGPAAVRLPGHPVEERPRTVPRPTHQRRLDRRGCVGAHHLVPRRQGASASGSRRVPDPRPERAG